MGKTRFVFEISFLVGVIYILLRKFLNDPTVNMVFLALTAASILFEILYVLVLHKRDLISFGRSLAITGVFFCVNVLILIAVYAVSVLLRPVANVATIDSLTQLCGYYDLPLEFDIPGGTILIAALCVIYILLYNAITHKLENKISF